MQKKSPSSDNSDSRLYSRLNSFPDCCAIIKSLIFAVAALSGIFAVVNPAFAQTQITLHQLYSFTGGNDGEGPLGVLIQGTDGTFYGTTSGGGTNGYGTVFKMTPSGGLTSLHSFTGQYGDGETPLGALASGSDGNFYGVTSGTSPNGNPAVPGTVFQISPAGVFKTLYTFSGGNDGGYPLAGLVRGADRLFYGTTSYGGTSRYHMNNGTVFSITTNGTLTTLLSFGALTGGTAQNFDNGDVPHAKLVQGADGNFYGTTEYGGTLSSEGTVFKITTSGILTPLYSFAGPDGEYPTGALVQGSDSNFYGTTRQGGPGYNGYGPSGNGTVFEINSQGALSTLYSFTGGGDGSAPVGGLIQGADGNFYGATVYGGLNNAGTIFQMTPSGALTALVAFSGTNGSYPSTGLAQGNDGNLYGTTLEGGAASVTGGTVFSLTFVRPAVVIAQPTNQTVQCGANASFSLTAAGASPLSYQWYFGTNALSDGGLISGSSSTNLTLSSVAQSQAGTYTVVVTNAYGSVTSQPATLLVADTTPPVVTLNGSATMTVECHTSFTDPGATANDACVGILAVTTNGTVDTNSVGTYTISYVATDPTGNSATATRTVQVVDTAPPVITLIGPQTINVPQYSAFTDPGATAYDACAGTVAVTTNISPHITTLVSFNGSDGSYPSAALVQGIDGNFYGTTYEGGANGEGTVFKATTNGTLTTLVSFNGTNGAWPQTALVQGNDSNFYGVTSRGGASGKGTVFKITTNGTLTTLVSFNGTNGSQPAAALVQGNDGNFYGTTDTGGANSDGTAFKMTTNGTLTTLVSFNGGSGDLPASAAALIQGHDGNFYGTTDSGGANGDGTAFKITTNGALTTLVSFAGSPPIDPNGLVQGTDGNFYGTTWGGGPYSDGPFGGGGTIFKITTNGTLTTLVSFNNTDGANPDAALVQGNDGNFYGTTEGGGTNNEGAVFNITTNGTLTTLASFNDSNGAYPEAALVQANDGNFYGTTPNGGANNEGTVFQMTTTSINVNIPGIYIISYVATDPSGNSATNSRTVVVSALLAPIINVFPVSQPGEFFLQFTENPNVSFTVLASTNLALPSTNWTVLGPATLSNGIFQFTDTPPSNYPSRFYRLRSP